MLGFQHGYLLAPEIQDAQRILALLLERDTGKPWPFFRDRRQDRLLAPRRGPIPRGVAGHRRGSRRARRPAGRLGHRRHERLARVLPLLLQVVARSRTTSRSPPRPPLPEHCSAFVATGSYTADGKPVIGHNAWTGYMEGRRWNILFDILPQQGHRILMGRLSPA